MFFRKRPEEVKTCERHVFVLDHKDKYCVNAMCRVLKISESGYYRSAVLDCYNGEILSVAMDSNMKKGFASEP